MKHTNCQPGLAFSLAFPCVSPSFPPAWLILQKTVTIFDLALYPSCAKFPQPKPKTCLSDITQTMTETKTAAVILAAGLGTRMQSAMPKVLHPLAGRPMLAHLLDTVAALDLGPIVVVTGPGMDAVAAAAKPHPAAVQSEQLGTGHAVLASSRCV